MRLWVDTDVGDDPDDAIALLCAARHPDVELVGVSTVDGDHARRTRIARSLVDAPVHPGDDPVLPDAFEAAAPEALLAIGPLTNVAAWTGRLRLPPVTLMGGLLAPVRHWGAAMETEHNFARDPQSAATVLGAVEPLVMPLDVTVATCLDGATLPRLLAAAPVLEPAVAAFLALQRDVGVPAEHRTVCLHDPLALLAIVEPGLTRVEPRSLRVESDGRLVAAADGAPCRLVVDADVPRVIDTVLGLVARNVG